MKVNINSETGKLNAVIMHKPGVEIERMTPENAAKALYSDILNLHSASIEYKQFYGAISQFAHIYTVDQLLEDILEIDNVKSTLLKQILHNESISDLYELFYKMNNKELSKILIEGYENPEKTGDRYILKPLYNLFFTRDASVSINNNVLICKMASDVRDRERFIMDAIFTYHTEIKTQTINPTNLTKELANINIEGGDVQIASEDILVIGNSARTSIEAIELLAEYYRKNNIDKDIIVQRLPDTPESFIHLDMVFTFLGNNECMAYENVILNNPKYPTTKISIKNGVITKNNEIDIPNALNKLGMPIKTVKCGGNDSWNQEREQWHSGANFFCLEPGKIIGYGQNTRTIEELKKAGFEHVQANDIASGKVDKNDFPKMVITINGAELSRGGGGARCMTMPVNRDII